MKKQLYNLKFLRILIFIISILLIGSKQLKAQVNTYTFTQSSGTFTTINNLAGTVNLTTVGSGTYDDAAYQNIPIGFNFTYNGACQTILGVSQNGFIQFGANVPLNSYNALSTYTNVISVINNDLYGIGTNGAIMMYRLTGTSGSRVLTMEWRNWGFYSSGNAELNAQIQLYEATGEVRMVYGNCAGIVTSTLAVGLNGNATTDYLNRTTTTSWATTTAGTANSATCSYSSSILPANGLTFSYTKTIPACAGTPSPGNTLSTIVSACAGKNFTLSTQNCIVGTGLTYQWQESADNITYTDIVGATSATHTKQQTTSTWYRCNVTCGVNTGTSTALNVTQTSGLGCFVYCAASAANPTVTGTIGQVTFGNLVNPTTTPTPQVPNPTSTSGYTDFRSLTNASTFIKGVNYPISVYPIYNSTAYPMGVSVFIDFNQNNVWTDAGERFDLPYTGVTAATSSGSITIPNTALSGLTGMRVMMNYFGLPTNAGGCGPTSSSYGEVEDYLINILTPGPMSFDSVTTTQVTGSAILGTTNTPVISVVAYTTNILAARRATQLNFNTTGTTNTGDISNARVYYTGSSSVFNTDQQFGSTVTSPSGNFNVTGNQILSSGLNYFWLTYDITSNLAAGGNYIDAQCTQLTDSFLYVKTPIVSDPAGSRQLLPPLNGNYTVGVTGTYPTITAAINAITTLGAVGPVTFSLLDANYTNETFPITITAYPGMSPTNTLTIRPDATATNVLIQNSNLTTGVFLFNGAKYVTIDGRPGGTGTTKALSVVNFSTASFSAVSFLNDANSCNLQYCNFRSTNTLTSGVNAGTVYIGTSTGFNGNDSITISNNYFGPTSLGRYANAVYSQGQSVNIQNNNITVTNNDFNHFGHNGVYCLTTGNGSYWNVSNNSFYDTSTTTVYVSTWTAINLVPGTTSNANYYTVNNNYIGGQAPLCGGSPLTSTQSGFLRQGILLTTATGPANTIYGNVIQNIFLNNTAISSQFTGISATGGAVNIDSNIIGSLTVPNSLNFVTNSIFLGINATSTGVNLNITRNVIANITNNFITGTIGGVRGMNIGGSATTNITNNIIRGLTTNSANIGSLTTVSMAGIICSGSGTNNITNNTIGTGLGAVDGLSNTNNSISGVRVTGLYVGGGVTTISNNIIDGLSMNNTATTTLGTTTSANMLGICNASTLAGQLTSNNIVRHLFINSISAAQTTQMIGILHGSIGAHTVTGNTVYGLLSRSTNTGTSTSSAVNAIMNSSSGRSIITNNYIDSIIVNSVTGTTTSMHGILVSGSAGNEVSGNTIKSMYSNSNTTYGIQGIYFISGAINQNILNNRVFNLVNFNATATTTSIAGIRIISSTALTSNTNIIDRNFVHSFRLHSTTAGSAAMIGIENQQGLNTFTNNMVRLGVDSLGNNFSGPYIVYGLHDFFNASNIPSYYFNNSVYIAGAPTSGTSITAAMFSPNSSKPLTIRNNIFVNNTTNAGGTGLNYALRINNTFNISSNYNILFAPNTNGFIASTISPATNFNTLLGAGGWINVARLDAQSGNVNPAFLTPNGTSSTLDLRLAASNPAEGGGDPTLTPVVSVLNDFDNNVRSTLTPNDIGANAGNFTLSADAIAPTINYTILTNTSSVSNAVLTANVIDNGGIPSDISSTLKPRIYFKRSTDVTWYSTAGTLASGNSRNGNWNLTIDYSLLPSPAIAPGNTIQYYVIAQDSGVNITSNPLYAIASNVNTVTTVPTLNSYNITSPLDTIIIVGPAPSNYLTLSAAFTAINAGVLQGNTRIFIKAGTIVEPTSPTLNQWLEINNGTMGTYNYTLTIRPQTTALTTLSLGFNSITLNGADRVTFLGYDTLGTINDTNLVVTSTQTALNIQNDASGNTFRNVVFAGSSTFVVFISSSAITTGNDNQTFDKCKFRASNLPTMPSYIFYNNGTVGRENDSLLIQNCEFYNASFSQLYLQGNLGNMIRIKNNHFYQQLSSSLVYNIYFAPSLISNNDTISGNSIGGTTLNANGTPLINAYTSQYIPIYIAQVGSQTGVSITDNVIKNITMTTQGYIWGIYAQTGVANISRNMVGDTTSISPKGISLSVTSTTQSYGIFSQSGSPITINNNYISNFTSAGNGAIAGIQNSNGVTQMNNNLVQNFTNTNVAGASVRLIGIQNSVSTISQINGNTVRNFLCNSANTGLTTSAAVLGIMNNSATALSISNNTVQNLTNTNNTATNVMYGIYHSSGLATMSGNTVDGLTSSGTYTGTATIAGLGGIFNASGTAGQTISNNVVRNLTQTGAVIAGTQAIGLLVSAGGQHVISGNTIQGIKSNSLSTATLTGASIIGLYITASSAQMVVSNNNINTLENTYNAAANAVNVTGMYYSNTITTGTNIIDRNIIHSLKAISLGTCGINGMFINASTNGTFSNNIIRLGIDSNANAFIYPYAINGMFVNTGSVNDYYHNSIYIGGAPTSGASNTHAFQMAIGSSSVVNIKNNIFQNAVLSGGSLGNNYAIRLSSATNINCNNNIYFTPTNIYSFVGNLGGVNYSTLAGANSWQLGTGLDANSGFGDPLFINATGAGAFVNLRLQNTNPAEGNGDATVTSVTTDFDGNSRSTLTPSDIGANAGNFTKGTDIFAPVITYSPINNTGDQTGPVIVSGINVIDPQGIYTSGTLSPKLYVKKGLNGTFTAISPSAFTGTSRNALFSFTINYAAFGGVVVNDSIFYYVVAQDSAGNISSAPTYAVATNVNSIIADPTNAGFFRILPALPAGSKFMVGNGQTFPSFTNAGGLFEFLNNNAIGGNISAVVTSNITGETGAFTLSQLGETGVGAGSFSLTIRPDSNTSSIRTISGNAASGLFFLNGADRIKFNGIPDNSTNNSLQLLRIRNNSTTAPTIVFTNGAQGNRLTNLIIEGGNSTLNSIGSGVISFTNPSALAGNSFDSITNCVIRNSSILTAPLGVPTIAIQSFTSSLSVLNSNNYINGNNIQNFGAYGINTEVGTGSNWNISGNSFFNDLISPPNSLGLTIINIRFNAGLLSEGNIISNNFIGGQLANAAGSAWTNNLNIGFQGIVYNGGNNVAGIIQNNIVKNINLTSISTSAQFAGINHTGGRLTIGGSSLTGNTLGDPLTTNSISLAGATTHFGITTGTAVASVPLNVTHNAIQGITINSPGNTGGFNGFAMNGGLLTLSNNTVGSATTIGSITTNINGLTRGIVVAVPVGVAPTTTVTNNTIANMLNNGNEASVAVNGMNITGTSVTTVTGNSIFNLSTNSSNSISGVGNTTAATGIVYNASGAPAGSVINDNLIYNISANSTATVLTNVAAISATGPISMEINRNRIYDIRNLSTSSGFNPMATASGILLGSFNSFVNIYNNQISLGNGVSNNVQFNGIWASQTNAAMFIYAMYNSVVLSGSVTSGNLPSYAFHRGNNTTGEISMNLRLVNNVLVNARTGGLTKNYAIANEVSGTASGTGWSSSGIDYNLLGSSSASTVGLWANSDQTINIWRTTSGSDINSYYDITGTSANQIDVATLFPNYLTANFTPNTSSSQSWYLNGKGIAGSVSNSVTTDYSSNTRGTTLGFGTDIGAYEFTTNTTPLPAVLSGSIVVGQTQTISFANREIGSIT
ncbi:MAG: GEVED domain-containing protein, partial [Bacteroidota bacterium]